MSPGRLTGKCAFILGAAGRDNMGQVIARQMHAEGAKVIVAGRHGVELARLARDLDGSYVNCDLADAASIRAAVDDARSQMGAINVAVNAAGWGLLKPFLDTTQEELERMTHVSFTGPFILFQSLVKAMIDGGSIIQMSSATATIMLNDHAAYMGAKAGFDHVVRCIANEFGDRGIRCNSISPGLTMTPMTQKRAAIPGLIEAYQKVYPLGRIGTCNDIAEAACWLASDGCFMTGQNLQVNGGLTLRGNPSREEIARSIALHASGDAT